VVDGGSSKPSVMVSVGKEQKIFSPEEISAAVIAK
jgi:hypothetical protein